MLRIGVALAAALVSGLCRADGPGPRDDVDTHTVVPYTVACAGRSECAPSDQLDIKPVDTTAPPLAAACLRFVGVATPPTRSLPLRPASAGKPPDPNSYPLSPLVERWLRDADIETAFRAAPRARQAVDLILVSSAGARFKSSLIFDLSPLWVSGVLPLKITKVDCSPCRLGGVLTLTVPDLATRPGAASAGRPGTG